jgi:hypothetical protein
VTAPMRTPRLRRPESPPQVAKIAVEAPPQ